MLLAYITYVCRGDFIKIICAKLSSACGSEEIPTEHCGEEALSLRLFG